MEREKGEYLDMDEDKRRELDQQAQEYVADAPQQPAMNADPAAHPDAAAGDDTGDAASRVET